MASKRTRSERFLWEQQRLREQSNDKLRKGIASDREFAYNTQRRNQSRPAPTPITWEEAEARASVFMVLLRMAWFGLINYFIIYFFYLWFGYNLIAAGVGLLVCIAWWRWRYNRRNG